ncbi:hypothetical protein [Lacrimispora sp.]|uniref:hypothetical protein n=1 Tax=Lacrimispora sp. TaxID=2719234 RepID=UPI002ED5CE40
MASIICLPAGGINLLVTMAGLALWLFMRRAPICMDLIRTRVCAGRTIKAVKDITWFRCN